MVQTASGRSEQKRAEILRRAAEVFSAKGFFGAGMREIAAGLGMAPGALYYYFESKEDLLYTCQMLSAQRLLESADKIAASAAPPDRKLRDLARAHLNHILGEFGGSAAHIEFHALPAPLLAEVVSKRDAYERVVRRVLREGIEDGLFVRTDVKLAALSLLGALNWTVVWWKPEGRRTPQGIADKIAETFLMGLKRS